MYDDKSFFLSGLQSQVGIQSRVLKERNHGALDIRHAFFLKKIKIDNRGDFFRTRE